MPFRNNNQNVTVVLIIISAIIVVTVINNIVASVRSDQASREREIVINSTIAVQEEIREFEQLHANQTQHIAELLTLGVERQDELISKLDQVITINNNSSNNSSSSDNAVKQ